MWNEPNVSEFWGEMTPSAADYVSLLQAAYAAVKAVRPEAVVLGGSLAGTDTAYLQAMYDAGAKGHFDALHPYSDAPDDCADPRWAYQCGVENIRHLMLNENDDQAIWFTEFGWSSFDGAGGEVYRRSI